MTDASCTVANGRRGVVESAPTLGGAASPLPPLDVDDFRGRLCNGEGCAGDLAGESLLGFTGRRDTAMGGSGFGGGGPRGAANAANREDTSCDAVRR